MITDGEQHLARRSLSFLCRGPSRVGPGLVAKTILDVGFLGWDKPVSPSNLMVLVIVRSLSLLIREHFCQSWPWNIWHCAMSADDLGCSSPDHNMVSPLGNLPYLIVTVYDEHFIYWPS